MNLSYLLPIIKSIENKFWFAAGKRDAVVEESVSGLPEELSKRAAKKYPILFRCAKRSILPNKAETSQKRMRSFYGQNSTAQSHKTGYFLTVLFCIFWAIRKKILKRLDFLTPTNQLKKIWESEWSTIFFIMLWTCYIFPQNSNLPEKPQILQHKFLILLQQPKSASKERRYPIFVALERGLNASR